MRRPGLFLAIVTAVSLLIGGGIGAGVTLLVTGDGGDSGGTVIRTPTPTPSTTATPGATAAVSPAATATPAGADPALLGALRKYVEERLGQILYDDCEAAPPGEGLCAVYLGPSLAEQAFLLGVPKTDDSRGVAFLEREGEGWSVNRLDPPPCRNQLPCPGVGATVRIEVETACLNVRGEPGRAAPVVACLPDGETRVVDDGPVEKDAYNWLHLAGSGWAADNWLLCVKDCEP